MSALAHQWAWLGAVAEGPLPGVALATWLSAWTFAGHWVRLRPPGRRRAAPLGPSRAPAARAPGAVYHAPHAAA